jgi:macrodomain Ter protein organizer (MatP/YcbG family)
MPRPRYQLTEADVPVVHRWVQAKLRDPTWPQPDAARPARHQLARVQPTVAALHAWCARWLNTAQWRQLQAVIRAARRDARQTRTVRLSTSAYARLHDLATREQLTLSETIERYLAVAPGRVPELCG